MEYIPDVKKAYITKLAINIYMIIYIANRIIIIMYTNTIMHGVTRNDK